MLSWTDVLISPTYNPRYLAVSLGAVTLLAARGFTGILDGVAKRSRALVPVAGLLLTALVLGVTMPQYLHERTPYAKDGGADFHTSTQGAESTGHVRASALRHSLGPALVFELCKVL